MAVWVASLPLLRALTALNPALAAAVHKGSMAGPHAPTGWCSELGIRSGGPLRHPILFPIHTVLILVGSEGKLFMKQKYTLKSLWR